MNISFVVKGDPKALKRHRSVRCGKFIRQYDPSQGSKADFLALAHKHAPKKPIETPISLKTCFIFLRPKNHYRTNGEVKPKFVNARPGKPDADNLVKFVMDALNKVFWRDDSLIYFAEIEKRYGDSPATLISVWWDNCHLNESNSQGKQNTTVGMF